MLTKLNVRLFSTRMPILNAGMFDFRKLSPLPSVRGIIQKEHQKPLGRKSFLAFRTIQKALTKKAPKYQTSVDKKLATNSPMAAESEVLSNYYLENCLSAGAYTDSFGVRAFRENVAKFLSLRDGTPTSFENIRLGDSIFDDMKQICLMLSHDKKNCFILPNNQLAEIYSGLEDLRSPMSVFSCSTSSWADTFANIKEAVEKARAKDLRPAAIFINNPGDFGIYTQREEQLRDFVEFCYANNLLILANESYHSYASAAEPFRRSS